MALVEPAQQRALLSVARRALAAHLGRGWGAPDPYETHPELTRPSGAFVSLHRGHDLRGCIGTFESGRPLVETVRSMAVSAATRDPRFPPVGADELDDLTIEISVLGATRPAQPSEVEVGRHGLCVSRDRFRGVLLPQVARENRWTAQEFLMHTCRKAGLWEHAWQDPQTVVEVFEAEVFSE
ncbi:MAG: AmmeMemoRadiSam system protein A [Deltaproteobacteria bacterium]|nr:AmmeMemoRadiSam system protein A [Deltaproteobacteria bacterium]